MVIRALVLIAILFCLSVLPICRGCALNPQYTERIARDLSAFKDGITPEMIRTAKAYPHTCPVMVKEHQIISNCLSASQRKLLSSIAQYLPNMEFVLNELDEPRIMKNRCPTDAEWQSCACDRDYQIPAHGFFLKPATWSPIHEKVPIFSSGTIASCFSDILMPSSLHLEHKAFNAPDIDWRDKRFKAVWRGTTTGGSFSDDSLHYSLFHRQRLVALCSAIDECDAKFSSYYQCRQDICDAMRREYGETDFVPLDHQFQNKIIIDIDGNTYSGRYPLLLASGSAVFKVAAFEDISTIVTEPWKHYVPVKMDLSDFKEKLEWAKSHDAELEKIAIEAKKQATRWLSFEAYQCYMTRLLLAYADLLVPETSPVHVSSL